MWLCSVSTQRSSSTTLCFTAVEIQALIREASDVIVVLRWSL
ncbi:hypothetical protein RchiOBHm_Chr7g0197911 [Rosa chinensis]|uniref:Uncharacterized protein n=1 Tax=Rosa chinensis TaxID=74649 RepID=A0A2P6P716_ROSCH|nr:hypothetical protein RchiOBHm_Chr7g0197911 [Rosa chinensis]